MLFIIGVILDQVIKIFVTYNMPKKIILKDIFEITYAKNTGGVFGIAEGSNLILSAIAFLIIGIIYVYIQKNVPKKTTKRYAWELVLAGGVGNLIDRIFRGYVTDFILLKPFGIFNIADMFIVFGAAILILIEIFEMIKRKKINEDSRRIQ